MKKERCLGIVDKVLVFDGKGANGSDWDLEEGLHVRFTELIQAQRPVCPCEWMDAEDPLFILYTSGSTGRPKGELIFQLFKSCSYLDVIYFHVLILQVVSPLLLSLGLVHTTAGYSLYVMFTTANSFGISQQTGPTPPDAPHKDVFACVADAGWITGKVQV